MPTTLAISSIQAMVCLTAMVPYTFVAVRVEVEARRDLEASYNGLADGGSAQH
jgi:hypothetical protein